MERHMEVELRHHAGGGVICLLSDAPDMIALWEHCLPHHRTSVLHPAWQYHASDKSVEETAFVRIVRPLLRYHGVWAQVVKREEEVDADG